LIYKKLIDETFEPEKLFIQVELTEGKRSFEADNNNRHYIAFLRQLSEENPNDPHYLEWVEAGNNPEEFWTQDQDLAEPTEPTKEK